MSDGKDKASTDTRAPDRPGVSATAPGKVPSEVRQAPLAHSSTDADVADFVRRMKELGPQVAMGRGRLIFAMDATMSRQPTWDMALALQADMFQAVKAGGGLDVQLIYFRGTAECRASRWVPAPTPPPARRPRCPCPDASPQT